MTCVRTVCWKGKVKTIEVKDHVFAYSGQIPCTGVRRCIYCHKYEDEIKDNRRSKT